MPTITGTAASEVLTGTEADDDFHPLGGTDTVNALGGADRMFWASGEGVDTFNGGAGHDTVLADVVDHVGLLSVRLNTSRYDLYRPESGSGTDLFRATDTERLEIVLGGPASAVTNFVVHVFSPPPVFDLVLDARANLNGITTRISGLAISSFTVLGSAFGDILVGGAVSGGDHLFGYGGADLLAGNGELVGGSGDDTYFATAGSTLTELAGEGTDTVYTRSAEFTLAPNIENLNRGARDSYFYGSPTLQYSNSGIGRGNDLGNRIEGFGRQFGMGGDDVLVGGIGADVLAGGAGNDSLQGGSGLDTADYSTAAAGVVVTLDQVQPMATNDGDGGVDTLISIENLTGSQFNDTLIGDGGVNVLTGGAGRDYLIGLAGNDVLIGGAGASNTLQGGAGDDRYVISAVGDTAIERVGEGMDTVETTLGVLTLRSNVEILRFTGVGSFTGTGSAEDNLIVGGGSDDILIGMGGDDRLEGGNGGDVFRGGLGNDEFIGGGGLDTADYSGVGSGVTVKLNNSRATNDGEGGADTFSGVENVTGSAFSDLLIGDAFANVLTGGAGGDILLGQAGNDVLVGGTGAGNQMQGGIGDDRYVVASAGDTLIELANEGTDTVETVLATHSLRANIENLIYTGAGSFTGIGNAANNAMTGGAGADSFTGRQGDDSITGGLGTDTVIMSGLRADYTIQAGADFITIGDSVVGRDGIDTLRGIERIRFSNGEVLDVSPPAAGSEAASLAAVTEILTGHRWAMEAPTGDIQLSLPGSVDRWDIL